MAGWLLGRDELLKAAKTTDGIAPIRKILLLTDGHLNAGITEPPSVEALTRAGLEKDEIRTSCLGFGDGFDGLQKITVQNLRLRIQPKLFCNAWKQFERRRFCSGEKQKS
jgi:hypothetical protein